MLSFCGWCTKNYSNFRQLSLDVFVMFILLQYITFELLHLDETGNMR